MHLRHCAMLGVTFVLLVGFASAQDDGKRAASQPNDNLQQRLDSFEKKLSVLFDHAGKDLTTLKRSFDEVRTELKVLRDDVERLRKHEAVIQDQVRAQLMDTQRQFEVFRHQHERLEKERGEKEAKAKQAGSMALTPRPLRHSKADEALKLVRELLQDDAKRMRLAADLRTNTVLIYANREDVELVINILQIVDRDDGK
jgi:type II secretory pathway component GspD/PulD (secretin)